MTSAQTNARAEEVAKVRGYVTAQAAKLTPAQIVEKVRDSQASVLAAAESIPADRFNTAPADGDWSAAEVLYHVLTVVGDHSRAVVSAIRSGAPTRVRPDRLEHLTRQVTLGEAKQLLADERGELFEVASAADPDARLDITVMNHPEFGQFNWRETLLFVRVHDLDHARQLQQIAAAVGKPTPVALRPPLPNREG
ncbi:MAG: DinB family protein [Dehalococcoidia bacterium]